MHHKMKVYVNGRIVPAGRAISAFEWGLNYGYGLFETLRTYRGRPAFLEDHIERLSNSAAAFEIATDRLEEVEAAIGRVLRANGLEGRDARVKIILTKGVSEAVTEPPDSPTLVITATPLDTERIERLKRHGIGAMILDGWGGCGRYKTLNHLKNIMGRLEATKRGAHEGILTTKAGQVLEGTASNLFIIEGRTLRTPHTRGGLILPGVTRKKTIEAAKGMGLCVEQCVVRKEELFGAEGLLLTNSVLEIVPVRTLEGQRVGSVTGRKITRKLQKSFSEMIENLP